jgi:hypothetical protein
MYTLAHLNNDQLQRIKDFEKESGVKLLAMDNLAVQPAPLGPDHLKQLESLEGDLGVCLVAVE